MAVLSKCTSDYRMPKAILPEIEYFSESIDFNFTDEDAVRKAITHLQEQEQVRIESINVIFCSDDYLLNINQAYLQHDYYTDIITFQQQESPIQGELYISIDRVTENADTFSVSFKQELLRVIIHGVLHLSGYADSTEDEKIEMRYREDYYLQLLTPSI